MTGRIIPRGENKWQIRLDFGRDETGKRIQTTETVNGGIRAAQRRLNELLAEHKDGPKAAPQRQTVAEYLDYWLERGAKPSVSPRTLEGYASIIRTHVAPKLGAIQLSKLTPIHIQNYEANLLVEGRIRDGRGLSPQTVLHHHRLLFVAMKQAVAWRLLDRNPVEGVKAPSVERDDRPILEDDGVMVLLRHLAPTRFFVPALVTLATGIRRGELLALHWAEVDMEKRKLEIRYSLEQTKAGLRFKTPKTKKSRRAIYFPPIVLEALKKHQAQQREFQRQLGPAWVDHDLVFPYTQGQPWVPGEFSNIFSDLRRQVNVPTTYHDLRHSVASQLLRDGVHLKVVSDLLGHSSVVMTGDLYSHVTDQGRDQISEHTERSLRRALEDNPEG